MMSVNLEKPLKYLKIQESLIFLCFSLLWKILYKHEIKQVIELAKTLCFFA